MQSQTSPHSNDPIRRPGQATNLAASYDRRTRSEESWVEISSQPSSSSLSSANEEVITTGLRLQHDPRARRHRAPRHNVSSSLNISHRPSSAGGLSSQEEYEESESESDRVMTSSGEGPILSANARFPRSPAMQSTASDDSGPQPFDSDDEERTAINYPIRRNQSFTPQPNAFSHPPSIHARNASQPVPGSYFPQQRPRASTRQSLPAYQDTIRQPHQPQNLLSPSYNAAAHHDEALRNSLSTLLSCAAAARGLQKPDPKRQGPTSAPQQQGHPRPNRIEPSSLRLVPESALPAASSAAAPSPTFNPTLPRHDSTTTASSDPALDHLPAPALRRGPHHTDPSAATRPRSPRLRGLKKPATRRHRRYSSASSTASTVASADALGAIEPTLLTWVVSAGVVVVLSALSFGAGFLLRRAAVRAIAQPSRTFSTRPSSSPRVSTLRVSQPTLSRSFHQARIWRAEEQEKSAAEPVKEEPTAAEQADIVEESVATPEAADAANLSATPSPQDAMAESSGTTSEPLGQSEVHSQSQSESVVEKAKETASNVADKASDAATAAAAGAQSAANAAKASIPGDASIDPPGRRGRDSTNFAPNNVLYVGNLFFEVKPEELRAEFDKFGTIDDVRLVRDHRGLSKGFGYVTFESKDAAAAARDAMDQQVYMGRRMAVQFHVRRERQSPERSSGTNPPSKTLFIGNMSYQMSDRDLNDLFREVRDVLDVRVAIDRKSGQPRGFAHADFINIQAAKTASEYLSKKVLYGRTLRVDFSGQKTKTQDEQL